MTMTEHTPDINHSEHIDVSEVSIEDLQSSANEVDAFTCEQHENEAAFISKVEEIRERHALALEEVYGIRRELDDIIAHIQQIVQLQTVNNNEYTASMYQKDELESRLDRINEQLLETRKAILEAKELEMVQTAAKEERQATIQQLASEAPSDEVMSQLYALHDYGVSHTRIPGGESFEIVKRRLKDALFALTTDEEQVKVQLQQMQDKIQTHRSTAEEYKNKYDNAMSDAGKVRNNLSAAMIYVAAHPFPEKFLSSEEYTQHLHDKFQRAVVPQVVDQVS